MIKTNMHRNRKQLAEYLQRMRQRRQMNDPAEQVQDVLYVDDFGSVYVDQTGKPYKV